MVLSDFLKKNLAQDIEASGKTRKEFNFTAYLAKDSTVALYGPIGDPRRRDLQRKFDELKRKSPKAYLWFLDRHKVDSGEAFKRELRESQRNEENDGDDDDDQGDDDDQDDDDEPAAIDKTPPPKLSPTIKMKPKSSNVEGLTDSFRNLKIPKEIATMSSTSSYASTEPTSIVLQQVEILSQFKMDGTADFPYIIMVDPNNAERNFGFEVSYVQKIEFQNFTRDIFHIRKVIGVDQDGAWAATIPTKKYPDLANRAVLIRGPSQDYWHKSSERYHMDSFCDRTKLVHESLETMISTNIDRQYSHWLLVFPEETQLENHIISGDSVHVTKGTVDLVGSFEICDDKGKTQVIENYGMDVHWRIAVQGGEMIRSPDASNKKTKRFANRKKL